VALSAGNIHTHTPKRTLTYFSNSNLKRGKDGSSFAKMGEQKETTKRDTLNSSCLCHENRPLLPNINL